MKQIQLENKIIEAESKFLKSQINPHFIFNALNNIYSLSQIQSPKTPDAILKLSQLLRYVIYDSSSEKVTVEKEVDYIISFIDLQKLKDEDIGKNIDLDINLVNNSAKIAPMILIPFIENSFKHGHLEDTENSWLEIKIKTTKNKIIFTCKNSIPKFEIKKDEIGGIGLDNVTKRLDLIYSGKYKLIINQNDNIFSVDLSIDTK